MQRGEALVVEPFLDAGDALVVDIDVAEQMRDFGAVRIIALVLVEEADARQALVIDLALLFRGDVALEPDETAPRRQPLAQLGGVEIGQVCGEQFDRLVDVDEAARLGVERRHAHVGRQHFAVAVEDVGPRGGDGVAGNHAMGDAAVGDGGEHHEPHGDDAIDDGEGDDRQSHPRPRLGGAIAVAPVKQAAQEPAPPGLGRRGRDRFRSRAHRLQRSAWLVRRRRGRRRRNGSRHRLGRIQIADHAADRIVVGGAGVIGRPFRQAIEAVELGRRDRLEL